MYTSIRFPTKIIYLCILVLTNSGCTQHTNSNYSRVLRQASDNRCTLPPHPQFGLWTIYDFSSQLSPGERVPSRTVLKLTCQENYKLDSYDIATCVSGGWKPEIGKCLLACPTINSNSIMTVSCTLNGLKLDSCARPFDGTIARFECARYYENQGQEEDPFRLCSNGNWIGSLPKCVPRCGRISATNDPILIVGGNETEKRAYPWQVALYHATDKVLLCGGTLLNQRVIVTAAHCITNNKGKLLPKELFTVAVGNYFRKYNHSDDAEDAQFSPIHEMYIPRQYKGDVHHYFGDISLIVTTKTFQISKSVRPICVIWEPRRYEALTDPTRMKQAYVSGWGFTEEHQNPSDVLKHLAAPLISDAECNRRLSDEDSEDAEYMTDDKMCAGFINSNTSVCKGDSGGGLVVKYRKHYYIIGIVSISPRGETQHGGCNSQLYTLYTRFSYYIENFILEKEAQFRPGLYCQDDDNCNIDVSVTTPTTPTTTTTTTTTTTESVTELSSSRCLLPNHPEFGRWSVFGAAGFQAGSSVASGAVLKVECNRNFKLDGQNLVYCQNGKWSSELGRCLTTCPPRVSTPTMHVTCIYERKETENCTEPVQGTLAKFRCAPFYEDLQLKRRPVHICSDGSWDQPIPQCVPVCGQKTVEPIKLIINGTNVTKEDYPWQVALYDKKKILICGGALISQRIVLTAAHCITDIHGELLPKENYVIAVGKYYRSFNDSRDYEAQFSELQAMFVPNEYRGDVQNYLGDIAILVSKNLFTLSRRVQPVCLDIGQNYRLAPNQIGYVSGWGFTTGISSSSEVLNELEVPSVFTSSECRKDLPENYEIYLTHDKMCAGFLAKGKSICRGDTGGGLVFKHDGSYYITGIASLSPSSPVGGCDSQQYSFYTDVSKYINHFILSKLAEYKS